MCLTFLKFISEILYSDTGSVNLNIPDDVTTNITQGFISKQIDSICPIVSMITSGVFLNSCQEVQVEAAGDLDGLEGHR